MSSRVQKGNTVFRPVAKPRGRQVSGTPAPRASQGPSAPPDSGNGPPPALSMPPPSSSRAASTSGSALSATSREPAVVLAARDITSVDLHRPSPALPTTPEIIAAQSPEQPISRAPPVASSSSAQLNPPSITLASSNSVIISSPGFSELSFALGPPISVPQDAHPILPPPVVPSTLVDSSIAALPTTFAHHFTNLNATGIPPVAAEASSHSDSIGQEVPTNTSATADANGQVGPAETHTVEVGSQPEHERKRRTSRARSRASSTRGGTDENLGVADNDGATAPLRKRRARSAATVNSATDDEGATAPKKKRRIRMSGAPRKTRRRRAPSVPPYDPAAEPGEELDLTSTTMSELCEDTGRGRISSKAAQIVSNHAAWKTSSKEKRARMRAALEAKKYGRTDDDEGPSNQTSATVIDIPSADSGRAEQPTASSQAASPTSSPRPGQDAETAGGFDYAETLNTSRFNVQVRIGPNGETIIDEQSLFVDRNDEEDATANYTHIEESDATKFVNSASYSKKGRGSRWSAEETELFFDALSQFGENYELIALLLPGRDRKACKNKFKAEDKKNANRINWCLNNRTPYDIATLARLTGKDFSGPTPVIRARTPPTLVEAEQADVSAKPAAAQKGRVRKHSRTPAQSDGEEILGAADGFDADGNAMGASSPPP